MALGDLTKKPEIGCGKKSGGWDGLPSKSAPVHVHSGMVAEFVLGRERWINWIRLFARSDRRAIHSAMARRG